MFVTSLVLPLFSVFIFAGLAGIMAGKSLNDHKQKALGKLRKAFKSTG